MNYNTKRKLGSIAYTSEMIVQEIKPYPNKLWNYGKKQQGANLISADNEKLKLALLPRATGTFSRKGLAVNGLRYKCEGFTEQYLKGGTCTVAYDPDNVSFVWLLEKGHYVKFDLIESRYKNKSLLEVENINTKIKELKSVDESQTIQAEIDLSKHITAIGTTAVQLHKPDIKVRNDV